MLLAIYWDLAVGAARVWYNSPTYNHGFLIAPICAYLVYERRAVFAALSPQPFLPILVLMPLAGAVWLIAHVAGILEAQQFVFMGMFQLLLLSVLGWRVYWALLFPCLYLFFLVPSGDYLVPTLQDFTGAFAVKGIELFGIPVHADGTIIEIPNGTFRVDEACAGLRFLIASIAFGFLFANLTYRGFARQAGFVVAIDRGADHRQWLARLRHHHARPSHRQPAGGGGGSHRLRLGLLRRGDAVPDLGRPQIPRQGAPRNSSARSSARPRRRGASGSAASSRLRWHWPRRPMPPICKAAPPQPPSR